MFVKKFCGNLENIFSTMGIDIDDECLMEDEIKESIYKFPSYNEEIMEDSFHVNQNTFQ